MKRAGPHYQPVFVLAVVLGFFLGLGFDHLLIRSTPQPPSNIVSGGSGSGIVRKYGTFRYGTTPWRTNTTLTAETLVESPFMKLEVHTVRTPKGRVVDDWLWFDIADQVNILPEVNGEYVVFKQMKYGLESESYAVVGGLIEKGETAAQAAVRELNEEMSLESSEMVFLGRFRTDVNRGGGFVNSFLAVGCKKSVHAAVSDDMEQQERITVSRERLIELVLSNQFHEVKWSNTVALALMKKQL
eukprot:PhF_6_TR10960/c0_g1_i2/m.17677